MCPLIFKFNEGVVLAKSRGACLTAAEPALLAVASIVQMANILVLNNINMFSQFLTLAVDMRLLGWLCFNLEKMCTSFYSPVNLKVGTIK